MCTLSLFRTANGLRVFMNRDERHDRPSELPPRLITAENGVFGPVDFLSGGTWIAYNQNGFWGCLLNGYFDDEDNAISGATYTSRGNILPTLLSQNDPIEAAKKFNPKGYLSFRLLIGSANDFITYQWDGTAYKETGFHGHYADRAFFMSSSSWKQEEVIAIRKQIFTDWIDENSDNLEHLVEIPCFHYSTEPEPESAPLMMRDYSGTKSITTLDIRAAGTTMGYHKVQEQHDTLSYKERETA